MSTTAGEALDVLRDAEPLSRESLKREALVEALWKEAGAHPQVEQTPFGVTVLYRSFEHSPAHQYEVTTALDYHDVADVPEKRVSAAFTERLREDES